MTWNLSVRERIVVREVDESIVTRLAQELQVSEGIARILVARKLFTYEECRKFFRPDYSHFHDPFLFTDMEKAVSRILDAIKNGEKITVYGDYDVDGVTSTVLMVRALRLLDANCDYYLPNRLTEGYGMSQCSVEQIAESGTRLIITVDCGVTAVDEVAFANKLGVDVIITDHHEPKEKLPDAFALIDHKIPQSTYPDHALAGVGVALKLCQALAIRSGYGEMLWVSSLELAALGTAADIVPMTGENRVIAKAGFEKLSSTEIVGLNALIAEQGLSGKPLSTSHVVFQIAPCINATGRLGDSRKGVELLLTTDKDEAMRLARELKEANIQRRALDNKVAEEACLWVEKNCTPDQDFVIVAGMSDWHVGVIGIVASKLVEKYHRPTILFSIDEYGMARGSGRSIPGLHLLDALDQCKEFLEAYGGHAAAAGMSIKKENIDAFRVRFNEVVGSLLSVDELVPLVTADAEISLPMVTEKFFRIIKQMEPFGPGNMRPVLFCKNLAHKYAPKIVGKNHLKLSVTSQGLILDAVGFDFGNRIRELRTNDTFSMAFTIDENVWNGKTSLQLKVKGISQ